MTGGTFDLFDRYCDGQNGFVTVMMMEPGVDPGFPVGGGANI